VALLSPAPPVGAANNGPRQIAGLKQAGSSERSTRALCGLLDRPGPCPSNRTRLNQSTCTTNEVVTISRCLSGMEPSSIGAFCRIESLSIQRDNCPLWENGLRWSSD